MHSHFLAWFEEKVKYAHTVVFHYKLVDVLANLQWILFFLDCSTSRFSISCLTISCPLHLKTRYCSARHLTPVFGTRTQHGNLRLHITLQHYVRRKEKKGRGQTPHTPRSSPESPRLGQSLETAKAQQNITQAESWHSHARSRSITTEHTLSTRTNKTKKREERNSRFSPSP